MNIDATATWKAIAQAVADLGGTVTFAGDPPDEDITAGLSEVQVDDEDAIEELDRLGWGEDEGEREPLDRARLQDFVFAVSGGDFHMASALAATLFDENETAAVDQALRLCRRAA